MSRRLFWRPRAVHARQNSGDQSGCIRSFEAAIQLRRTHTMSIKKAFDFAVSQLERSRGVGIKDTRRGFFAKVGAALASVPILSTGSTRAYAWNDGEDDGPWLSRSRAASWQAALCSRPQECSVPLSLAVPARPFTAIMFTRSFKSRSIHAPFRWCFGRAAVRPARALRRPPMGGRVINRFFCAAISASISSISRDVPRRQ